MFPGTRRGRKFQQGTRGTPEISKLLEGRHSLAGLISVTVVEGPDKDLGLDPLGQCWPRLLGYYFEIKGKNGSKPNRERQISDDMAHMWNLSLNMIQMNLFTKQNQTHRLKTNFWLSKRKGGGGDRLGLLYTYYCIK